MKRFFAVILICIIFYACKPGVPKELIQPAEMEKVLFDMHIAEGYMNAINDRDSAKKVSASFYKGIYKKFGIDSIIYNRSLNYYYKHPNVMKVMYEHITEKLLEAKNPKPKTPKKDSSKLKVVQ